MTLQGGGLQDTQYHCRPRGQGLMALSLWGGHSHPTRHHIAAAPVLHLGILHWRVSTRDAGHVPEALHQALGSHCLTASFASRLFADDNYWVVLSPWKLAGVQNTDYWPAAATSDEGTCALSQSQGSVDPRPRHTLFSNPATRRPSWIYLPGNQWPIW